MASQITSLTIVCLLNRVFSHRSQKTLKFRVTGLCVGNSPVTSEFPAQMAINAENVSIWWRHHAICMFSRRPMQWRRIARKTREPQHTYVHWFEGRMGRNELHRLKMSRYFMCWEWTGFGWVSHSPCFSSAARHKRKVSHSRAACSANWARLGSSFSNSIGWMTSGMGQGLKWQKPWTHWGRD